MKLARRLPLVLAVLLFASTLPAFALAGGLSHPGVAMPTNLPPAFHTNLTAALTDAKVKFLGGNFVNAFTSLRYGGETRALTLAEFRHTYDAVALLTPTPEARRTREDGPG